MEQTTDRRERARQARRAWNHRLALIKCGVFFLLLFVMAFIGLLWFARPSESTIEKRELTKFPTLTWSGFWDGSFLSGVDTWYADTYPLREGLISMNTSLQECYGIRSEQLAGDTDQQADEIPEGEVDLEALAGEQTEPAEGTSATPEETPTEPEPDAEEDKDDGTISTPAESAGSIYIANNSGFGLYYFSQSASAKYCLQVNQLARNLAGKANVYSLIAPISAGVMLDMSVQESMGCSDESEAISWMYSQMDNQVKTVNAFDTLRAHNSEYIYFHTDHHWTALGAYYAYEELCKVKGITPNPLDGFETCTFEDFLGTFYSSSNQSAALAANPDTVTAYIPKGTNDMTMYVSNGDGTYTEYGWSVVNDVSDYAKSELYASFAGGDQPYNYAHNEEKHDGSSVLIVKDSYGNAFIPFLIDHYEHIYWIDYRSYASYCTWAGTGSPAISALVQREGIQDVLLLNNINSTGSDSLLGYMEPLFQ